MFESAIALVEEHAALEQQMADPTVASTPDRLREVNTRYAALAPVVTAYRGWVVATDDLAAARELAEEDPAFAEEIPALTATVEACAEHLRRLLIPRDPDDDRDVILEVKAGEGGEESALFAGDLLRMYLRYAERAAGAPRSSTRPSPTSAATRMSGGGQGQGHPRTGRGAVGPAEVRGWRPPGATGAGHREPGAHPHLGGRRLVMPEADEVEVTIDPNDLRIDVYRSSGPGGQSVNTTDSAVRITHLPTGTVVSCQNEKSQLQNKESALRVLRARLHQVAADAAAEARPTMRAASQVRTVDRSERIRTYNFPENRIADHRTGFKAYNLDTVLDGELDPVVRSAIEADEAARLASAGEP
jgi:peptide chain release factor 1